MTTRCVLGVITALPDEAHGLGLREGAAPGLGHAISGIGARAAAQAARDLLGRGAQALLSAGYAGGICAELGSGDLILPDRLRIAASGHPIEGPLRRELQRLLDAHSIVATTGTLLDSAHVLASELDKLDARVETGADFVDMESAAIAEVARQAGAGFAVLRVILDDATTWLPREVLRCTDSSGRIRGAALTRAVLASPSLIGPLLKLARQRRAAQATLRRVAPLLPLLAASTGGGSDS